ncbi:hypothetical protein MTR_6g082910 [Medicago truncatula]|uniref:Uncharacterized protein n=1 Tax=Medicago truncatula TaxID=3880 RepID=A0A072UD41_MEDTR|nr:hypothetical protein MTR_6g082910 [Medicago truncatula]
MRLHRGTKFPMSSKESCFNHRGAMLLHRGTILQISDFKLTLTDPRENSCDQCLSLLQCELALGIVGKSPIQ